jgi:hypothetical protein
MAFLIDGCRETAGAAGRTGANCGTLKFSRFGGECVGGIERRALGLAWQIQISAGFQSGMFGDTGKDFGSDFNAS